MPEAARHDDVTRPADQPGMRAPDMISDHLHGERAVAVAEVGEWPAAA
jgi:hypothetical protein